MIRLLSPGKLTNQYNIYWKRKKKSIY